MSERQLRLAVDVGGTFTDATLFDPATGRLVSAKVLTTPENRAIGLLNGVRAALAAAGARAEQVRDLVHGSTTGTNALIERTGAKTGLLTTEGFCDVLEIGRIMRPRAGLYDFTVDRPLPLVPRRRRLEATERLDAAGRVITSLDESTVIAAARRFAADQVEAVAVCFLFSPLNAVHEEAAGRILAEHLPGVPISLSSRVCPEMREYERSSTVVVNAYLTPVMKNYLSDLKLRLQAELGAVRLFVIQANGGSASVDAVLDKAVTTVNSGPAGGVVAAAFYGNRHNRDRLVSVDMGGTSFDIGLIEDGVSKVTTEGSFQDLPVQIPIIDLHIIGAGGGSIGWLDPGGALNVGPQSAGALPGPACYGRGGRAPTVTDANLVLGRLNPDYFNGGRMQLDVKAARQVVGNLATAMGTSLEKAALGIIQVVNANMVKGIAEVTIQRGIDVRDFSLLSFGGAGGAHAVELARELGMAEAIIPPLPGTFSAVGLLVTEARRDYVASLGGVAAENTDLAAIESQFRSLEAQGTSDLSAQGFASDQIRLVRLADLKVTGQTYELSLPLPVGGVFDRAGLDALLEAFGRLYRERYAFFYEGETIEIVNLRVCALGMNVPVPLPSQEVQGPNPTQALKGRRPVFFAETGFIDTDVYERGQLKPGMVVPGPAVIEEETSSTILPPDCAADVAVDGGLFIRLGDQR